MNRHMSHDRRVLTDYSGSGHGDGLGFVGSVHLQSIRTSRQPEAQQKPTEGLIPERNDRADRASKLPNELARLSRQRAIAVGGLTT